MSTSSDTVGMGRRLESCMRTRNAASVPTRHAVDVGRCCQPRARPTLGEQSRGVVETKGVWRPRSVIAGTGVWTRSAKYHKLEGPRRATSNEHARHEKHKLVL